MEIIVEDNVYTTKNISVLSTGIFIKYEEKYFPFEHWTDFTFPMLEEWKYNLLKIENEKDILIDLWFHDGPFWLEVYKGENMDLEIRGISNRKEREIVFIEKIQFYDLLKLILEALSKLSDILIKNSLDKGTFKSIFTQTNKSINELKAKFI